MESFGDLKPPRQPLVTENIGSTHDPLHVSPEKLGPPQLVMLFRKSEAPAKAWLVNSS
jgi:hypothetical protein